ncbi:MAG: hypothetical protein M3Y82_07740 [Verrucomicrobiota bacterium]|nr:hypothetical protein [Verrucomicrobiota bacterium]
MKQIYLSTLIFLFALQSLFAKDAPASAEQLRSQVETAARRKDTNAFLSLFNWEGVSTEMKSFASEVAEETLKHDIAAVKLSPLPADFQSTNELEGIRYKPNVTILGIIEVEYVEKGNAAHLPYGKKGNAFYLPGTLEEKIPGPITKTKMLNVLVMGSAIPAAGVLSGSYVFVRAGKEIKQNISGKGSFSEAVRGDFIKSCTVQSSNDQEKIRVTLSEDDKKIFDMEKVANKEPIVYEKK